MVGPILSNKETDAPLTSILVVSSTPEAVGGAGRARRVVEVGDFVVVAVSAAFSCAALLDIDIVSCEVSLTGEVVG